MGSARKASRSSSSHEASPRNRKRDSSSPSTPNISSQASQDLAIRTVHFSGNEWPFLGRSPYQSSLVSAESREGPQPAIIWMSEAAMLEGRFHCAQLVALSIMAALSHDSHLGNELDGSGYDLRSITDRNQSEGSNNCLMGTYFVLAAVWPSKKLVKNSVQLSRQLAQSLCYPAVNTNIFVISVEGCCRREDIAKMLFMSPYSCGKKYNVLVHECKNLILEYDLLSINEIRIDENGQGKLCAKMYLDNETEKTKKVLVALATRWLYGRLLFPGNSVTISVCGMECNFIVKKTEAFDGKDDKKDTISNQDLNLHTEVDDILARCESLTVSSPMQNAFCISQKSLISFMAVEKSTTSVQSAISNSDKVEVNISRPKTSYSSLGGVSKQIEELKEIIDLSLLRPNILTRFGLKPTKGVLLYGPPGTGKTTLARAAVSEAGVGMFVINGPEIISEFYGQSEEALRTIFTLAENAAPSVVFIDELDAITPERKEGSESLGQRVIGTLLTLMDGGIKGSSVKVLVIAATNRPGSIDPALRRPGRFDREIEIGIPTPAGRQEILEAHLTSMSHDLSSSDVQELAAGTHGFVGADLFALCNEAAMAALRRYIEKHSLVSKDTSHQIDNLGKGKGTTHSDQTRGSYNSMQFGGHKNPQVSLSIIVEDFLIARAKVRPSTMREVMLEVPKVTWQDIGGQDEIKQQLKEAVEWPQKHSDALKRIGAQPPRGVLLYGPPGCSKTLLARAVAAETGLNFLAVKGPELFKKWVGESEKAVHMLFVRAKAAAPSVIFFDEIDGLAIARDSSHGEGLSVGDRVMSQLLVELDGLTPRGGVSVIAATNRPDKLDAALLRPGRFDRLLYVGPPNEASREEIFRIHLRNTACGSDVSIEDLANRTQFYTGADIEAVCHEAVMAALEENLDAEIICSRHFNHALSYVRPSAYDVDDSSYKRFTRG